MTYEVAGSLRIRHADERGRADWGWLDTRHTFTFDTYYDPEHMGFRTLRVLNDDRIAPGGGFPTHAHRDMEIVTWVLEGALEHRDSTGAGGIIRPGDVQRMTAGSGVRHSEFNPSDKEPLRLLQVWILPELRGLAPGYEQKSFPESEHRGRLRVIASPDGRDGSATIRQDAFISNAILSGDERLRHELVPGRGAWLQVARGGMMVEGIALGEGDGVAIEDARELLIEGMGEEAEVLLFDLA